MKRRTRFTKSWILAAALGLSTTPALARDDEKSGKGSEQTMKLEELPTPVQQTLRAEAKGGQIQEIKKETSGGGKVTYEAEIVRQGKSEEIEVDSSGKVLERETDEHEKGEHEKSEGKQQQQQPSQRGY